MVTKETSSLGFDIFLFWLHFESLNVGEKSLPIRRFKIWKYLQAFCNILTGLVRGLLLFEFGEIFIFHFISFWKWFVKWNFFA